MRKKNGGGGREERKRKKSHDNLELEFPADANETD
jgi:hypothetical protein